MLQEWVPNLIVRFVLCMHLWTSNCVYMATDKHCTWIVVRKFQRSENAVQTSQMGTA